MLSKNNFKEKLRKMEEQKQHFSIRTLSVGAVSVLIGLSFMTNAKTVRADTEVDAENPTVAHTTKQNNSQQVTQNNQKVTTPVTDENKVKSLASSADNNSSQVSVNRNVTKDVNKIGGGEEGSYCK